jgi:hypothetical protein
MDGNPYTSFLPPIKKVNEAIQGRITKLNNIYKSKHPTNYERVAFADCRKEIFDC